MSCGIYKITNKINNKVYIGQSINMEQRWKKHQNSKDDFLIHKAINKYNIVNFEFTILEECPQSDLDEKERYWINYYNSQAPNGYNMIDGGSNGAGLAKGKKVLQYDLKGNFIKEYSSAHQAELETGINYSSICACCREEIEHVKEYQWKYLESNKIIKPLNNVIINERKILQYDLSGNLINIFSTMKEVSDKTGISKSIISKVCNHKGNTGGGFFWAFEDDNEYINYFLNEIKKEKNKFKFKHTQRRI